jgi:hypothetical protein
LGDNFPSYDLIHQLRAQLLEFIVPRVPHGAMKAALEAA